MSDTPRTDALRKITMETCGCAWAGDAMEEVEKLERELTAAKRQPDLLMLMAMAPAEEIEGMIGETRASAAQFLGIADEEYEWRKHYHLAIAKGRRLWAEALIKEASK